MGAAASAASSFQDLTKEDVASAVSALGSNFDLYADAIVDNEINGYVLSSLLSADEDTELDETFDELGVTSHVHRRVLLVAVRGALSFSNKGPSLVGSGLNESVNSLLTEVLGDEEEGDAGTDGSNGKDARYNGAGETEESFASASATTIKMEDEAIKMEDEAKSDSDDSDATTDAPVEGAKKRGYKPDDSIESGVYDEDAAPPKKKRGRPRKKADDTAKPRSIKNVSNPPAIRQLRADKSKPHPEGLDSPPPGWRRAMRHPPLAETYNDLRAACEKKEQTSDEKDSAHRELERAQRLYGEAAARDAEADEWVTNARRLYYDAELSDPGILWNQQYQKLVSFYEEHGHSFVKKGEELNQWVMSQRQLYKAGKLLSYRREALERLNFVWEARADVWASRIRDLIAYRDATGTCDVPFKYPPNQSFAIWVHDQRRQYKWLAEGKPSIMTREKIQELDSLGFIWKSDFPRTKRKDTSNDPPPKTEEETWNANYEQLVRCYEEHGHCRIYIVQANPPHHLLRWMTWQRKQYHLFQDGEPSQLTPERIEKLDKINFVWKTTKPFNKI